MKPDALPNHAPAIPGIYELVTFDEAQNAKVLYVAYSGKASIAQCLQDHLAGTKQPTTQDLITKHSNLYFDFVILKGPATSEDYQDALWSLTQEHKPPYNTDATVPSGRFASVKLTPA